MTKGGGRTGFTKCALLAPPAQTIAGTQLAGLNRDHLAACELRPRHGTRARERFRNRREIVHGRMRSAPRCAEIPPVGTVPIPIAAFVLRPLALRVISNRATAETERRAR